LRAVVDPGFLADFIEAASGRIIRENEKTGG